MGEMIVARVMSKWRGLLVYYALLTAFRLVADWIFYGTHATGPKLYAIGLEVSASVYCIYQEWLLVSRDREGDDGWPRLWE